MIEAVARVIAEVSLCRVHPEQRQAHVDRSWKNWEAEATAAAHEALGAAAQLVLDAREYASKDEARRLQKLAQRILDLADAPTS